MDGKDEPWARQERGPGGANGRRQGQRRDAFGTPGARAKASGPGSSSSLTDRKLPWGKDHVRFPWMPPHLEAPPSHGLSLGLGFPFCKMGTTRPRFLSVRVAK